MGGVSFILYNSKNPVMNIGFTQAFMNLAHRGPDDTNYKVETTIPITRMNEEQIKMNLSRREWAEYTPYTFIYGFHRLAINDPSKDGSQPFEDPILHKMKKYPDLRSRVKRSLVCNGEIYNSKELIQSEGFTDADLQSGSDVEVIMPMYIKYGLEQTLQRLDGDYAFILTENLNTYDLKTINVYAVRDILGIKPLYMVKSKRPNEVFYMFVSELKGIPNIILEDTETYTIEEVPPGTYWSFNNSVICDNTNEFIRYSDWNYYRDLTNCTFRSTNPETLSSLYKTIRETLETCVMARANDEPTKIGVLLSGGFDSSIILGILARYLGSSGSSERTVIYAFTIGDSGDASKCVAYLEQSYGIDIHHHIINLNLEEPKEINLIGDIIYSLETYDSRVIREALPYAYLFRYIQQHTDVKVLLTGEGLDELCGYSQFFGLDDEQFQRKSVKLIKNLSKFDLLRADRMSSAYGLELRHPYLDKRFLELGLSIHPKLKRPQIYDTSKPPIEKYIIRKAFDNGNYINNESLWRTMESVYNETNTANLGDTFERKYTNLEFDKFIYSDLSSIPPRNKEEMHYKIVFNNLFGSGSLGKFKFWDQLWET